MLTIPLVYQAEEVRSLHMKSGMPHEETCHVSSALLVSKSYAVFFLVATFVAKKKMVPMSRSKAPK